MSATRIRELEAAAWRAWPPAEWRECGGWRLAFSGGFTKRANSVQTLDLPDGSLDTAIARCEEAYAGRGLPCIFKLTDATRPRALDSALARRGYALVDPTSVQLRELVAPLPEMDRAVCIEPGPGRAWLAACARWGGLDGAAFAALVERIRAQRACAALPAPAGGSAPGAVALGVLDGERLGLFEVITAPEARGRGLAARVLESLFAWGAARGARIAWLQVVARNQPARRLYLRLGFREIYRHWYRVGARP